MVCLNDLLAQLKESENMDFCGDLTNIQSIFNYANEYIKPLNKIRFRGGNAPYIADINAKMMTLFKRKGYFDINTSKPLHQYRAELRKITFYLILNTEATFKYDLASDYTICHLINTMTLLPKALLHACIWGLSLEYYFCECIAYTPIWFAYQFIDNVVESLKFADPYETLDRVEHLVKAIYTNIARSDFRHMELVDKKIILNKYYDVTMDLMRHFYSPDAEKFQKWSKNKYRKYIGYVLKHILSMIQHCFALFQQRPVLKSDPIEYNVFALMREREPLVDDHRESYSEVVIDTLHRMNTTLLNSLQFNVMQVDCNAFMYWVEIDIDSECTLQRLVGEAAFDVEQLINVNECFAHDVAVQLKSIVVKPLTTQQKIQQIETIGEWIERLEKLVDQNEPNMDQWLNGFIDHGELVLGNVECLEALELHAKSLTVPTIKRLIKFATNEKDDKDFVVEEKLIEICLNSFDQLSETEIIELIQYSLNEQKNGFAQLQLENFDQFLIEVFNKTAFTHDRNSYYKLLFQSPQLFYEKVFTEALTTDVQMEHMLGIVSATQPIFQNFAANQLNSLIESGNPSDVQDVQLLPKLLSKLFFVDVWNPTEFIVTILYKRHLVEALKNGDLDRIELLITTLNLIAIKFKFEGMCPPLLVMSSQVLELYRWDLIKFTDQLMSIVTKVIDFISAILKVFLPNASQNEKSWIIPKIAAYTPLTRFYFQKLALPKDRTPKTLLEFLWPSGRPMDKVNCAKFLCEYLVRCTSKEMIWLSAEPQLRDYFWDAFELIAAIVIQSNKNQGNEMNCLKYLCNSLLLVVQKIMLPATETDADRGLVLTKMLKMLITLHSMPFFGEILVIVQPILVKNIDNCEASCLKLLRQEVELCLSQLPDASEAKTLLTQTLSKLYKE